MKRCQEKNPLDKFAAGEYGIGVGGDVAVDKPDRKEKRMNAAMMTGWWFSSEAKLPNNDGRAVTVGDWLEVDGKIEICERGLHFSRRALDALQYAPGSLCWYVEADGEIVKYDDKAVCSRRRALWMVDAEPVLRRFARSCALDVLHLWDAPEIVREHLVTGDESKLDAARYAAWVAAWVATRYATWDDPRALAKDAAWYAARATARATRAAARDAAWSAARALAKDAAWEAARDAQNARLEAMLRSYKDGTLDLSAPLEVPTR
jgi:hypothetical protein